jgi:hypothetical protein
MKGTTPVPGPIITIGTFGSLGCKNYESLMNILLVTLKAEKSLTDSYMSLRYFDVRPIFVEPSGKVSLVKEIAILTSLGYFKLLEAIV